MLCWTLFCFALHPVCDSFWVYFSKSGLCSSHCECVSHAALFHRIDSRKCSPLKLLEDSGLCTCIWRVNNLFQSIRGVSDLVDGELLIYRSNLKGSNSGPVCQVSLQHLSPDLPRVPLTSLGWNLWLRWFSLILTESNTASCWAILILQQLTSTSTLLTSAVYLAALLKLVRLCSWCSNTFYMTPDVSPGTHHTVRWTQTAAGGSLGTHWIGGAEH